MVLVNNARLLQKVVQDVTSNWCPLEMVAFVRKRDALKPVCYFYNVR